MPRASVPAGPTGGLAALRQRLAAFIAPRASAPAWTPRPRAAGGVFDGAIGGRLVADFHGPILSPNQEVQWHARTLRGRARALVRNNAYAAGFVDELANNVIGPDGILLQAKVADRAGKLNAATNRAIEAAWGEWDHPEHASADGHDSWVDLQRLVIQTVAVDGECFVRKLPYFDNPFGFALQLLDADLLDEGFHRPAGAGVNAIEQGIEIDRYGRPVAYWFFTRHPSEVGAQSRVPVPAADIEHLFVRYRANQGRGVTWFAPVLLDVKMLDGYEEAELVAARTAAAKMGFIVNKTDDAIQAFGAYVPPKDADGNLVPRELNAAPGVIDELMPGQEFQAFDPTHPSSAFKEFTKAILRGIARGLGMAYTTLTGDLEAVNYSSIRAGLLSERDRYRTLQRWLAKRLHRRVYGEWLRMALLSGALRVDTRLASDYADVTWKPRGWKWVDPVNDLEAAALAIALGLDSRQRLAAEQGRDFEDIVDELAHEQEYADDAGVSVAPPQPGQGAADSQADPADAGAAPNRSGAQSALRLASHFAERRAARALRVAR